MNFYELISTHFEQFELILLIFSCFYPFTAVFTHLHGQKRGILSKITHFKLFLTHLELFLTILTCFYPF